MSARPTLAAWNSRTVSRVRLYMCQSGNEWCRIDVEYPSIKTHLGMVVSFRLASLREMLGIAVRTNLTPSDLHDIQVFGVFFLLPLSDYLQFLLGFWTRFFPAASLRCILMTNL